MRPEVFLLVPLLLSASVGTREEGGHWAWTCDVKSERCQRTFQASSWGEPQRHSLPVCRLTCGRFGALWPRPTGSTALGQQLVSLHPSAVHFQILNAVNEAKEYLLENTRIFHDNLVKECGGNCSLPGEAEVTVFLSVENSGLSLNWNTDESYTLQVKTKDKSVLVEISATNVFGVRHGLETLTQLVASFPSADRHRGLVMVTEAKIQDRPAFRHRGLLLDTARNFLPMATIKRQIDAMGASKMNVLHWHATDSQSFPLELPRLPQMARFGAYSSKQTYTPEDVGRLLQYAKLRGVRVILEIDAPSHVGNGWQWGSDAGLGNLAVCVNQQPWRSYCIQPPCGQLNPVNPRLFDVLGDLYRDVVDMLPKGEVMHMGGDEVFIPCWNSTPEIVEHMESSGKGRTAEAFMDLWGEYQKAALSTYDSVVGHRNTPIILWSSALTDPEVIYKYLPKTRYVINTWVPTSESLPQRLLDMGYHLIMATKDAWYLDHGFWGVTRYYPWRKCYDNRLPAHSNVLGGEVCMWGELVDEHSIDTRIWPRAAAAAERLWTNPDTRSGAAESRFYQHRERLVARGVQNEALAPRWCYQNEGECT